MPPVPFSTAPFLSPPMPVHRQHTQSFRRSQQPPHATGHIVSPSTDTAVNTSCSTTNASRRSTSTLLSLLHSHSKAGLMHEARALFNELPSRTPVSYTILMSGYTIHGPANEALSLFRDMLQEPSIVALKPDPFVSSVVLRACASSGSLNRGRELHCLVLKMGYLEDLFVANALVTMYGSCGSLRDSELAYREIQQPDFVSWSSMLSAFAAECEEALQLFKEMGTAGIHFDAFSLSIVLKASANLACLDFGIQVHCCMPKMGLDSCLFLANCLMEFYGRLEELCPMRQVFDKIGIKDMVSWNTAIALHVHNLNNKEALRLFSAFMKEGSNCDEFTLGSVLQEVTSLRVLNRGKEIHGYAIRAGLESSSHVISAVPDMYIHCSNDVVPLKLFRNIQSMGDELNTFILASVLKSCAMQLDIETGKIVHSCIIKRGILKSDPILISSLIDMFSKCRSLESSDLVFAGFEGHSTGSWSAIIAGHCSKDRFKEALQLFRKMQLDHVKANEFTYTSVILACASLRDLRIGKVIHCNVIRTGYIANASVVNTLIIFYSEVRQHNRALEVCSSVSVNDLSWCSLIQALARREDHEMVLELFGKIQYFNGQLDHTSACHVLKACGASMLFNVGIQAHAYIIKRGLATEL